MWNNAPGFVVHQPIKHLCRSAQRTAWSDVPQLCMTWMHCGLYTTHGEQRPSVQHFLPTMYINASTKTFKTPTSTPWVEMEHFRSSLPAATTLVLCLESLTVQFFYQVGVIRTCCTGSQLHQSPQRMKQLMRILSGPCPPHLHGLRSAYQHNRLQIHQPEYSHNLAALDRLVPPTNAFIQPPCPLCNTKKRKN